MVEHSLSIPQKLPLVISLISERKPGLDRVWIIGDDFCMSTYHRFFKDCKNNDGEPTTFTFKNFEVKGNFSDSQSVNKSPISRIRNCLVHALNNNTMLPTLIVMVLEDDVIKMVRKEKQAISVNLGTLLNWLVNEVHRCIETHKEFLPLKAKKHDFPHVLWIAPPLHCNFSDNCNECRVKFNKCLKSIISLFPEMTTLRMVKLWDIEDNNLYVRET